MAAAKAITKIRGGLLGPFAWSLTAHLALACPLLLLGPAAVRQPRVAAGVVPVPITIRLADLGEQPAVLAPAGGPPTLVSLPSRRAARPPSRLPPPPPLAQAATPAGQAAEPAAPAAAPETPAHGALADSPVAAPEGGQLPASPTAGDRTVLPARSATASGSAPRAPGWNPGDGPWTLLRQAIERHVSYPTIGRRMGWAGRVVLTFVLRADGGVGEVRVQESSGHAVLDERALQAVHRAVPLPHPNRALRIVLPIEFALR